MAKRSGNEGIQFGGYYKDPVLGVFARVDGFETRDDKHHVLFALWNPAQPFGWQEGAGLEIDQFDSSYTELSTKDEAEKAKPLMRIRITATFEYTVDPLKAIPAYGTTDPTLILEIDSENAWQIIYDEMADGDNVRIEIEEVKP